MKSDIASVNSELKSKITSSQLTGSQPSNLNELNTNALIDVDLPIGSQQLINIS